MTIFTADTRDARSLPPAGLDVDASTTPGCAHTTWGPVTGVMATGQDASVEVRGTASSGGSILLLGEDSDLGLYLRALLGAHGWRITAAQDLLSALADTQPSDLVLVLPGTDGLAPLRALRAEARWQTVPIVVLSAGAGTDLLVEALSAGADDYLDAPFDPRELLARLRAHRHRTIRRNQALRAAEERIDGLGAALESNRRIGLALGIVMAREGLTEDAAFRRLRQASNVRNLKMRDLAEVVVYTGQLDASGR